MSGHPTRARELRAELCFVWSLGSSLAARLRFPFNASPPAIELVTFIWAVAHPTAP